jgi:tyrosine decarboxylase
MCLTLVLQYADSFNTNPNKWLLINFDCSCFWVRDKFALINAMSVDPLYLQHKHGEKAVDYRVSEPMSDASETTR